MQKNNYPGKFIAIDGIDGAGKSTQMAFIKDWFKKNGFDVSSGHEPKETTKYGTKIHDVLFKRAPMPESPLEFQKLYIHDRKEHLETEIIPSLKKENSVYVVDRYFTATIAYGMAGGVSMEEILKAHEDIIGDEFILPDVIIIIDTSPEVATKRLLKFKGADEDVFEKKKDFQKKVSDAFKKMSDKFENFYLVNGDLSVEEINKQIDNILKKHFK